MDVGDCGTRWHRALGVRGNRNWREGRIFHWVSIKQEPTGCVMYSHWVAVWSLYVCVCKCVNGCVTRTAGMKCHL